MPQKNALFSEKMVVTYPSEPPEQRSRREILAQFWRGTDTYAKLPGFDQNVSIQTEKRRYERALRQLRLNPTQIRIHVMNRTLIVERIEPTPIKEKKRPKKRPEARLASLKRINEILSLQKP